jgi:hypothetical protein
MLPFLFLAGQKGLNPYHRSPIMPTKTIIRVNRRERYTIVSNIPIEDDSLSWKATAILVYLLSRPDDWETNPQHLAAVKKCGIKAVYSGLKELKEAGYIEHTFIRDEFGRIAKGIYIVHEEPIATATSTSKESCPHTQKGNTPKQKDEKRPLLNTEVKQNTDGTKGATPEPVSSGHRITAAVVPDKSVENLIDLIPECHRNGAVKARLIRGLNDHSPEYIEQAVQYARDNARDNFKAYLGKTIDFGWCEGYEPKESTNQGSTAAFLESRRQMPTAYLELEADRGCRVSTQVLRERGLRA